jgi:poly(hydroxyalkanoate) granule-associated protein
MATRKKPEAVIEETREEPNAPLEFARKLLLATIGATALAQEEIEGFVRRLIDKGEIAEKDGRKLLHEIMDKRRTRTSKAEDELTKRFENVMNRLSIPSKTDFDALNDKITALSKKIDELKKS